MLGTKWSMGAAWLVCCCAGRQAPVSAEPAAATAISSTAAIVQPTAAEPAGAAPTGAESEQLSAEPESASGPGPSEPSRASEAPAATPTDKGNEPRQVTYRASPESLIVEVDGLRLVPTAEPVKRANGSYGVRISVEVTTTDDSAHHLLAPTNGALSFFSKVLDKHGKVLFEHADQREGQEALLLTPGMHSELKREWPTDSASGVVWWGQTLHLEVGLWGLGRIEVDRRPLKRLFVVEMKAGAKPQARLLPPSLR